MSFKALSWAWEADVDTPGRKLVLVGLAQFANDKQECWPSQKTLAERTLQSERTVREHLAWLEATGFITRIPRKADEHRFDSDLIRLHIERTAPLLEEKPAEPAAIFAAGKTAGASGEKPQEPAAIFAGTQRQFSPPNLHVNLQEEPPTTPQPPKGGKANRAKATETDHDHLIPLQLQTPEFVEAWHSWAREQIKHRRPLSELSAKLQLRRLDAEAGTPAEAIRWIESSIEKRYRAPFSPPGGFQSRRAAAPRSEADAAFLVQLEARGARPC